MILSALGFSKEIEADYPKGEKFSLKWEKANSLGHGFNLFRGRKLLNRLCQILVGLFISCEGSTYERHEVFEVNKIEGFYNPI